MYKERKIEINAENQALVKFDENGLPITVFFKPALHGLSFVELEKLILDLETALLEIAEEITNEIHAAGVSGSEAQNTSETDQTTDQGEKSDQAPPIEA